MTKLAKLEEEALSYSSEGEVVEPSTALARPKASVADFLRTVAADLDSGRAVVAGTSFSFEKLRVKSDRYDLFIGRFDPDRHRY